MGYTHYYYTAERFDPARFAAVAADFERMVTPLRHLGVVLADGLGEGSPIISPAEIRFNGAAKCGHEKRELGLTWPAPGASGVLKNSVTTQLAEITKSAWYMGAELKRRSCNGDCSYGTFELLAETDCYIETPHGRIRKDPVSGHKIPGYDGKYFDHVKTAYRPYDLAVTVCLVIAKHHLGDDIMVDSDGDMDDWREAVLLCQHFLGYGMDFCLDDETSSPMEMVPHA